MFPPPPSISVTLTHISHAPPQSISTTPSIISRTPHLYYPSHLYHSHTHPFHFAHSQLHPYHRWQRRSKYPIFLHWLGIIHSSLKAIKNSYKIFQNTKITKSLNTNVCCYVTGLKNLVHVRIVHHTCTKHHEICTKVFVRNTSVYLFLNPILASWKKIR